VLSADPARIVDSRLLVLPGVGSFGAGMKRLTELGVVEHIRERIRQRRPLLSICLGFQMLFESSTESPGVGGISALPGRFEPFSEQVRSPQFGWNSVQPGENCVLLKPGYAYFANSFRLQQPPEGWRISCSTHGGPFVAAVESGPVLGCQFHPELSGRWGDELLNSWLSRSQETAAC